LFATYGYDAGHNRTTITASAGSTLAPRGLSYDGFGRLATLTTGSVTTTYSYDPDGRPVAQAHSSGVATYTYRSGTNWPG